LLPATARHRNFKKKSFSSVSCLYIANSFPYISQKTGLSIGGYSETQATENNATPMSRQKHPGPKCCKGDHMLFPEELLYNEDHVWVEEDGDQATIGITEYLEDTMDEILSVEMPEVGTELELGDTLATIELRKGVMEIYSPLSGEVVETNQDLADAPEWLNSSPYEDGWLIRMTIAEVEEIEDLMDADEYTEFVQG
jgi:glycine cleavage system H protein